MTVIEIRPFRNGWKCFEALGVEPVFLDQGQAIDYAVGRACFRSGEIRILNLRNWLLRTGRGAALLSSSCALTFCRPTRHARIVF